MKKNDIFRWSYKEEYRKTLKLEPYWAKAQLAEFDGEMLYDLYWSDGSGVKFSLEEAEQKLDLVFLGNLDDYEYVSYPEDLKGRYCEEDILNLTHQNSMGKKVYLKKGAELDRETILKSLEEDFQRLEQKQRDLESERKQWLQVSEEVEKGNLKAYYRI